jgi:hypothetical protein
MVQSSPDLCDGLTPVVFAKGHIGVALGLSLERANKSKRRTHVVGISPNDDCIIHVVGALMLEQNDEWAEVGKFISRFGKGID